MVDIATVVASRSAWMAAAHLAYHSTTVMERLLVAKLSAPRPSRPPIRRPRLAEMLSAAPHARLILLAAPPGFGKTTTLLDWLETCGMRHAWISLDETDNDPVRFVRYLRAAVATLATGDWVASAEAGSAADLLDVVAELAALLGEAPEPCVLVLDDYHVITSAEVQRVTAVLLEHLPPQAHLAIAARADPALPLARLRARGELLELRADVLRFDAAEADRFFRDRLGIELPEPDLEALVGRTEGWPAALQLAGLSLMAHPDVAAHVHDFAATHRHLLDYVIEEVLAGLPPETERFLLRTSILSRLSGPLCDSITGEENGQATLESLERANLLIVPLDDERRWYRYHAVLAEILRARLTALHEADVPELHARASAWFEAHGDDDAAIAHALRCGDSDRLSRLVAEASGRHITAGEVSTVRRWLDEVPADLVRNHAQLSASYAWCLIIAGETEGVAERLDDADRALAAGHDGGPVMRLAIPSQLAMLRSQLAGLQGDATTAIAQARLAAELVPAGLPPEADAIMRGMATVLLGLAFSNARELEQAAAAFEAALPDLRRGGNVMALGRAIADLAAIYVRRGDAERAVRLCESELERAAADRSVAATGSVWAAAAEAWRTLGQFERAEAAAQRAIELAARAGDGPTVRSAQTTLARIAEVAADRRHPRAVSSAPGLVEPLTGRELEVLRLVALGRSNSQIAAELFVTPGTVKSHLHTISGKLGAANRVEAVAHAREFGLLP